MAVNLEGSQPLVSPGILPGRAIVDDLVSNRSREVQRMKVYEGTIISCDREDHIYSHLIEDRGRILHVGHELPEAYRGAPREALGTRALLPSFGDTHLHFASHALFSAGLDVRSARSLPEMSDRIRKFAQENRDAIIMGFGASTHSVQEKRLISRKELDRACPDRAVFIVKYDGHACIVNGKMIDLLPRRLKALRGWHEETGEMNQEAFFAVTDFVTKKVSLPRTIRNMLRAVDAMAGKGFGMMHTVSGVGFPLDLDVTMETILGRGLDSGFQSRLFFQTMDLAKVKKRKLPRVGGCFATALDGCFGSEDAALRQPYSNNPQNRGVLFYSDETVIDFVKRANRAGLQIEMHAIGDAAFEQAVLAIETALKDFPRQDHRHGIIHACLPTEEGLETCARLGVQIPLQPAFLYWDLEPAEFVQSLLGKRAEGILPLRKMTDMGIMLSGGSDAPCTLPDPIAGIHAACNHPVPGQSLTIPEALKLFTWNAAWTAFDERERGSLEVGKIADMVILNRNPLTMKPGDLLGLKVENLLLKGEPYRGGQGMASLLFRGLRSGGKI
ncbi:MAG: amidohydrolase family protein [Deltaproteobacteria bacterium]|nr:amidohydrolase family protein [Deltaproteobacteria bacterium]